ncbi:SMC family ATPase [Candidatus Woesearchaeota archaeon]|nr:SMC family ATPase [Candidatus Woesearchaeota archaeon]
MLIKSIKLNNIRSYESQEISFPLGSVLLAGDIGSGKSSILLAIEFAIFGAKKGELPAYTLLRHGKKEGSVELRMEIEGKDIMIKRALKRSNEDIKQEAGYVVVNGLKKEGTSEELRAIVLEMLGYPKELVKKGKDMIYRYTVYTPQEEMKQILYESKDNRLDTLRKVFNIDKYKRIKENLRIITASLRERKKHLEGFTLDMEYKKKELAERKSEIFEIDKSIEAILPKIEEVKNEINEKKKSIESIGNDIKELSSLRSELSAAESSLSHKIEQNNRLNNEIKLLDRQTEELKNELENKKFNEFEVIKNKIDNKENEIKEAELNYKNTIKKIRELEVKIEHCNETMGKIQELDICPVCEQKVDEQHKQDVHLRESKRHIGLVEQVKGFADEESKLEKIKIQLKRELDAFVREQSHLSVLKIKFEHLNEKTSAREEKSALKESIKKEIGLLNAKKTMLNPRIEKHAEAEEKYKIARKEIDGLLPQERFLELEKRKYEAEKESIKRFIAGMEKEIDEKQKAKERLAYISQLGSWIDELFVNLMSAMEKHVMVNIHSQFNGLFKSWFDILMEDEAINVRVDEDFTPVIEQDGYETYVENLSGGERTAVALSYRLALNKVINDIVAEIKTNDIIILDEPTDGFSYEQLDKIRDILSQLSMKQVIIVSHESKIESFVENVIRVNKHENVSAVG